MRSDERALSAGQAVVFVESVSMRHGVAAGGFGDIVVLNIETGNRFNVTNDGYYDERPLWSPDGTSLAFISAREGTPRYLRLSGTTARKSIYTFDIESKMLRKVGTCLNKILPSPNIEAFGWSSERTIAVPYENKLYEFDVANDTCWLLHEFQELLGKEVDDVRFSRDGSHVVLRFYEHPSLREGIAIRERSGSVRVIADSLTFGRFIDWTVDGGSFIYQRDVQFHEYETASGKDQLFELPKKVAALRPLGFQVLVNGDIVFHADRSEDQELEIALYKAESDSIKFLTATNREKKRLELR